MNDESMTYWANNVRARPGTCSQCGNIGTVTTIQTKALPLRRLDALTLIVCSDCARDIVEATRFQGADVYAQDAFGWRPASVDGWNNEAVASKDGD